MLKFITDQAKYLSTVVFKHNWCRVWWFGGKKRHTGRQVLLLFICCQKLSTAGAKTYLAFLPRKTIQDHTVLAYLWFYNYQQTESWYHAFVVKITGHESHRTYLEAIVPLRQMQTSKPNRTDRFPKSLTGGVKQHIIDRNIVQHNVNETSSTIDDKLQCWTHMLWSFR